MPAAAEDPYCALSERDAAPISAFTRFSRSLVSVIDPDSGLKYFEPRLPAIANPSSVGS